MLKQIDKILLVAFILIASLPHAFAIMACSITTVGGCTNTVVLRMSSQNNAHAEIATGTTPAYDNNVICCTGLSSLSCIGNHSATVLNLSSTTNAHVEIATNNTYPIKACINGGSEIPIITYQDSSCIGYDTTLASISSSTNATIASPTHYTKKVCGSLVPASITFSISTTTLYFGGISPLITRYASSADSGGSDTEVEAHTISIRTNALNGYVVDVLGGTLTYNINAITPIGNVNTAPAVGVSQFGLRAVASGGSGTVSSPYAASGFAFAASATTSSRVASATAGDDATTTYSLRYVVNIDPSVPGGPYVANLVYIATANF